MNIAWKRIGPTESKKVWWRTLVEKRFALPDGKKMSMTTINPEGTQCAAVIALTPDNQVVIARQFRPGPEMICEELPGGGVDAGEDIEAGVRRELLEETGYQAGDLAFLGSTFKDGYNNATFSYFLATNCTRATQSVEQQPGEYIEVVLISVAQLMANAKAGKMSDAEAVLFAYEQLTALTKTT